MTPELWQRLKPLFYAALDRDIAARAAFINEVCGDDAELKKNLEQLLQAAQEDNGTLDRPFVTPLRAEEGRFNPGEVILGRFRIVRPIGRGGMGEVYEAEDIQLGRVALKTIRDDIASSSLAFSRFRKEVQLARKVSGPHVCRIHELYLLPESGAHSATAFLTMEYLDGTTLSEKLNKDGPLPLKEALQIALDICEGLSVVHGVGVIHRDLKSANIMLCGPDNSFRAVLMDFGLARDFNSTDNPAQSQAETQSNDRTQAGAIMGTPAYMAPEQFEGKPVSPASDLYALGVVLYEIVTGIHPYAAPTPAAAAIRRAQHPLSPSSLRRAIPRKWDRVIQRCLQYEPKDRYQSASDVAKALRSGPANLNNLRQDRPWLFRTACVLLLAAMAWGSFRWWQTTQYYHPGPEALRWYDAGVLSLKEGNYVKATNFLQKALTVDRHFVMAHAHLAEASYYQDLEGGAQKEMLVAIAGKDHVAPFEEMYIDAINATVTGNLADAVRDYTGILSRLPESEKSSGNVDLGMAYEHAGDMTHALKCYANASVADANNPAAFIRTGVLQSRLHRIAEAKRAFDQAQDFFKTEDNREGLAELDYQRGYAANEDGDFVTARERLLRALTEANEIRSVQLETRTLSQLSSVEYNSSNDDKAIEYANRVIQNAQTYGLPYWTADGLMRLGFAYFDKEDFDKSESFLQQALRLSRQNQNPRIEADSAFGLASLRDQENKYDEQISFAQIALKYYSDFGFVTEAADSSILLVRGEENKGDLAKAQQMSGEVLKLAINTNSRVSIEHAEEAIGDVSVDLEDYPSALAHFERALQLSRAIGDMDAYQVLHCADALWRLGRYPEAQQMLHSISANASKRLDINTGIAVISSHLLLSQGRNGPALEVATRAINQFPTMPDGKKIALMQVIAAGKARQGQIGKAQRQIDELLGLSQRQGDQDTVAEINLLAAEVELGAHLPEKAIRSAGLAHDYFAEKAKPESEWLTLFYISKASAALGDFAIRAKSAKEAVDILDKLEHNWGSPTFHLYATRPDYQQLLKELAKLNSN